MKKHIILIFLVSLTMTQPDVFGQKTKKDRKKQKQTKQTEQPAGRDVVVSPTQKETTPKNRSAERGTAESTLIRPFEVVNFEELLGAAKPVVTSRPTGTINWTEQYIEAKGSSVIDYGRFPNQAQARAMATRGAIVVAQRNLLEIIEGVNVVSETTVKDMTVQNDYIYTRIDGIVKGARQHGEPVEKDGMIEVTMRIPMYENNGLASAVYDDVKNLPGVGTRKLPADLIVKDGEIPNGLVFNFKGKQFDPSMFPMVIDQNGKVLLDLTQFYDPAEGKFPKILSGTKDLFTELSFSKGTQVIDVLESYKGKIVIDDETVKKINWDKIQKGFSTAGKILKFILTVI